MSLLIRYSPFIAHFLVFADRSDMLSRIILIQYTIISIKHEWLYKNHKGVHHLLWCIMQFIYEDESQTAHQRYSIVPSPWWWSKRVVKDRTENSFTNLFSSPSEVLVLCFKIDHNPRNVSFRWCILHQFKPRLYENTNKNDEIRRS